MWYFKLKFYLACVSAKLPFYHAILQVVLRQKQYQTLVQITGNKSVL